jgi:SAM-dependent methyltransferase
MSVDLKPAPEAPVISPPPQPPHAISQQERAQYRPSDLDECIERLRGYFDAFAMQRDGWRRRNSGYHQELLHYFRFYVAKNSSVMEVGCGTGELLAALEPSRGLGVDLSSEMIRVASEKFPHLMFMQSPMEKAKPTGETFDYIILSDLIGFSFDILTLFKSLKPWCHARTRIVINMHSRVWQPLLNFCENVGLKYRQPVLNWVTTEDVTNLLALAGFETVQTDSRVLLPARIPLVSRFANRFLAPFRPFRWFCLTNWVVARPRVEAPERAKPTVSVICPCRNEAGNIDAIARRLPKMGSRMELIFVEGHSKDVTYDACVKAQKDYPDLDITVYKQSGKGKKDAVWLGFAKAKYDVLMILDADISVLPEDLPAFYEALATGKAEFVNGSRLVYPMEGRAMRFLNLCGNKFFSLAFSYLIGQHVKDTLCGTKVLLKSDFDRLMAGRGYFGEFDPFGDFDLLFGAAKLGLKIVDLPIRYRERVYGETQISRFRHGWMLLKMCGVALLRLKMR